MLPHDQSNFLDLLQARLSHNSKPLIITKPPHHHHNRFTALFRDHPGELVPEENFSTLWCKGRLTEADTRTIRPGATPSRLTSAHLQHPPIFYRPDALPVAQPPVSKHYHNQTNAIHTQKCHRNTAVILTAN